MKKAYIRCNSGHYFSGGSNCPLDNWSSPQSQEFARAVEQLSIEGLDVSIKNLEELGVSEDTIQRIIIIEFGSEKSSFTGFVPEGYIFDDGRYVPISKLGWDFK